MAKKTTFDLWGFLDYVYPSIKEQLSDIGLVLDKEFNVSDGGTIKYEPQIMYTDDSVSIQYFDENEKTIGDILFNLELQEYTYDFPNWEEMGGSKYNDGGAIDKKKQTYEKWKDLVNMSKGELEKFYNSKEGKAAGISSDTAKELGISRGRTSAKWIMKMKETPHTKWTPEMWKWANKQISFISRMKGNKGDLYDDKGNKTRKHTSLLIWGHNPNKRYEDGGLIAPNGKKSNLTPEQYKLVRTPEFKVWFGDWENDADNASKVIDDNGEPLVVYHYSPKDFTIFDKKYHPKIANFLENKEHKHLGYDFSTKEGFFKRKDSFEYKVFLNVRNLLNTKNATEKQFEPLIKILSSIPFYSHYDYRKLDLERDIKELKKGEWDSLEIPSIEKYLSKKYDGLVMLERDWLNVKVYDNKNIKLADGTNTTFDGSNPDIRYGDGGSVEVDATAKELEKVNDSDIKDIVQKPILEKFDDVEIKSIQSLRHKLHSEQTKRIFSNADDFDNNIEKIADAIDALNIIGNENGIAKQIRSYSNKEGGDRMWDGGEYDDMSKEDYESQAYNEIYQEQEDINNIVESYLKNIDEVWDNYDLSSISDIRGKGTFAPSGYERARSLLGTGKNNTAKAESFDNKIHKITAEAYHKAKADGSNPELVKAVEQSIPTQDVKSFYTWFCNWYKGVCDKIDIMISLPNEISGLKAIPYEDDNVVILDMFRKKDQSIDAKPYLQTILNKADEYKINIYLLPDPNYKYIDDIQYRKKISTKYLIDYYNDFGFELTPNKEFMKRVCKYTKGGKVLVGEKDYSKFKKPHTLDEIAKKNGVSMKNLSIALKQGIEIEMEHTNSTQVAKTIALHHLYEFPDYYSRLHEMEMKAEAEKLEGYYHSGGTTKNGASCEIIIDNERATDKKSIESMTDCIMDLPQTKFLNYDFEKDAYKDERRKLHREIIFELKKGLVCVEKGQPIAILMGGSPASGKTTFLKKYRPYLLKHDILKIDADEIRSKLPEYKGWNAAQTHLETKDIVNRLLSDRNIGIPCLFDVIYDGTMSSTKSYLPLINLLKSLGYKVFIIYIDKVEKKVVIKRSLERYKKSGRFVPLEVIDDFYIKGKSALEQLKKEVDGYMIVDGSDSDYHVIERGGVQLPKNRNYSKIGEPINITSKEIVDEFKQGGETMQKQEASNTKAGGVIADLGNLTTIRGNADFRYSVIADLGNLTTIGGNAIFDNDVLRVQWLNIRNKEKSMLEGGGKLLTLNLKNNKMSNIKYNQLPHIEKLENGKNIMLMEDVFVGATESPKHIGARFAKVEVMGKGGIAKTLNLKVIDSWGVNPFSKHSIINRPIKNLMNKGRDLGTNVAQSIKDSFKQGGELNPDDKKTKDYIEHKSGDAGGLLVGKRHSEGGIKAINNGTGDKIEMEGGEVVITRNAVSDTDLHEFEGKKMTNREILSSINESGGGVSFAEGGENMSCRCMGKKYKYGGEEMTDFDIANSIKNKHISQETIKKGMDIEDKEHGETFKMLKDGKMTYQDFLKRIVSDHLKENAKYYDKQ